MDEYEQDSHLPICCCKTVSDLTWFRWLWSAESEVTKIRMNCIPHAEEGHLLEKEVHKILQGSYTRSVYLSWNNLIEADLCCDAGLLLVLEYFSQLYWGMWLQSEVLSYLDVLNLSRPPIQSISVKPEAQVDTGRDRFYFFLNKTNQPNKKTN